MKIMLVDHKVNTEEASWGTCDICTSYGEFDFAEFKFRDEHGNEYWVHGWEYESYYGPVSGMFIPENVFDFAAWLKDLDFPEGTEIDYYLLCQLSEDYALDN